MGPYPMYVDGKSLIEGGISSLLILTLGGAIRGMSKAVSSQSVTCEGLDFNCIAKQKAIIFDFIHLKMLLNLSVVSSPPHRIAF